MKKKTHWFLIALLCYWLPLNAQIKDTINVAVFLYDGVELLDFAGPAEALVAASYYTNTYHFNVYTVAKEAQLQSQGFLAITPNFQLEHAPPTDILVLPGGNAGTAINDGGTQTWIKSQLDQTNHILTICSGIYFLENQGVLRDIPVTTHHKIIPFLKEVLPSENVISEVKYVDAGKIVTSAGVSSGIEGALLMVAKIAGLEAANRTARYMEYPQWHIENGQIAYNPIEKAMNDEWSEQRPPFGLYDLAGYTALKNGQIEQATALFQKNTTFYPNSALAYHSLSKALAHASAWTPPTYEDFLMVLKEKGAAAGYELFKKTQEKYPTWKLFTLKDIAVRAANLIGQKNYSEAVLVLEMGVATYPNEVSLREQLVTCWIALKDISTAQKVLTIALEQFPDNAVLNAFLRDLNSDNK